MGDHDAVERLFTMPWRAQTPIPVIMNADSGHDEHGFR